MSIGGVEELGVPVCFCCASNLGSGTQCHHWPLVRIVWLRGTQAGPCFPRIMTIRIWRAIRSAVSTVDTALSRAGPWRDVGAEKGRDGRRQIVPVAGGGAIGTQGGFRGKRASCEGCCESRGLVVVCRCPCRDFGCKGRFVYSARNGRLPRAVARGGWPLIRRHPGGGQRERFWIWS